MGISPCPFPISLHTQPANAKIRELLVAHCANHILGTFPLVLLQVAVGTPTYFLESALYFC